MERIKDYLMYFCFVILSATITYGLIILIGSKNAVEPDIDTLVVEKVLFTITEFDSEKGSEIVIPEVCLEGWGPV